MISRTFQSEIDSAAFDTLHSACLRHELRPNVAHVEGRPRAGRGELVAGRNLKSKIE
jgi:hypothetical protein